MGASVPAGTSQHRLLAYEPSMRRVLTALVLALTVAVSAAVAASAHANAFRVGDRVLASPTGLSDAKYWRLCTVLEVKDGGNSYVARCDAQSSLGPETFTVLAEWVKAAPASTATSNTGGGTTGGKKAVACFKSDLAGKGASAHERAFRTAIRRNWERKRSSTDAAVTVMIQRIAIGSSHAFDRAFDPAGVYPVRATFRTCTDYSERIVIWTMTREHRCYQDTYGTWVCQGQAGPNTNVNDAKTSIDK